ncbi:hypothetical protein [Viridibacillus arvi]|uniref:hypothetical protein n=1 Tax=Viridibacillus arvi TaxID=263475 RepID=UPI003CFE225B
MKIKIGNNNKISKSFIGQKNELHNEKTQNKNFVERHPVLVSISITFIFGFLFLFSFWDKIVKFIENLFN